MAAAGDPTALRNLLLAGDDEQVTLALNKIRVRYPDPTESSFDPNNARGPVTAQLIASGMGIVDELHERMDSWTSELSTTIYWIANVTRIAATNSPDTDLIGAYEASHRLDRRAHAVSAATNDLERLEEHAQEALMKLYRYEAALILPELVDDLRARDDSDGVLNGVFLFNFVMNADSALKTELQQAVRDGLASGEFSIYDVAARFVGLAYVIGGSGKPSSASFYGSAFTELTGVPADSTEYNERKEWPDTSWERKREFAQKYVKAQPDEPAESAGGGDGAEGG